MAKFNEGDVIDIPLTVGTSGHTAGDVLGGLQTVDVGNVNDGSLLRRITVLGNGSDTPSLTFYFFDAQPSAILDDAVFLPTWADQKMLVAWSTISTWESALNSIVRTQSDEVNVDVPVDTLYVYIVDNTGGTYSASQFHIRLHFWLDGSED